MVGVVEVYKRYRRTVAVNGVTASWKQGVHAVLGPNGAGKSTLLRIVAMLEMPSDGSVSVFGVNGDRKAELLRGRVGYLPQSPTAPSRFSPRELVTYVGLLRDIHKDRLEGCVKQALEDLDVSDLSEHRFGTLSGGQRQRCALAAAIVGRPELLILDEPTSGLDPQQRVKFRRLLRELGQESVVLLSTHLVEDVQSGCDSVTVLSEGRAAFRGTIDGLRDRGSTSGHEGDVSAIEAGYIEILKPHGHP